MTTGLAQNKRDDEWEMIISSGLARYGYGATNYIPVAKFGKNNDIDTGGGYEDVWTGGGLYPFPTSAGTLTVVSGSDQDKAGGTGATQIYISGLDANYDALNETVTLNGITPVVTTGSFLRVNRMFILGTVGTNGTNVGLITATHGVAGKIAEIEANEGQTLQAVYTVPRGYNGYIQNVHTHIDKTATGLVFAEVYRRVNLGTFAGGWRVTRIGTASANTAFEDVLYNAGSSVSGGDDIRLAVEGVSGTNIVVTGGFDIALFKEV